MHAGPHLIVCQLGKDFMESSVIFACWSTFDCQSKPVLFQGLRRIWLIFTMSLTALKHCFVGKSLSHVNNGKKVRTQEGQFETAMNGMTSLLFQSWWERNMHLR